jgi:hypothetical protein
MNNYNLPFLDFHLVTAGPDDCNSDPSSFIKENPELEGKI